MVPDVPVDRRTALPVLRRRRPGAAARFVAGPGADDAVRIAAELVASGRLVALEHVPGRTADAAAELAALSGRVSAAGLAAHCELTVPVDRLGASSALHLATVVSAAGLTACLTGSAEVVDALDLPSVRIAVPAGVPGAEDRCRRVRDRRVRLVQGRGHSADLAFARCLDVLMAGGDALAVAATDPRLLAIAGERAAWYARPPESWEHVMPYGVRPTEQQRLVAAGGTVRVAVPSGPRALLAVVRRLVGRAAA